MNVGKFVHESKTFLNRHSSTILTCVGAAGVIATGVFSAKATPKALRLIEAAEEEKGDDLTKFEMVKVAAPVYIPAALIALSTVTCIFGANALNKRSQAALISAYTLLDSTYKEYREKVAEVYGKESEENIRNLIAKDKYEPSNKPDDEKQLFFDSFSMRYFEATIEDVLKAEHEFSKMFNNFGYATLDSFYELLGLSETDYGSELGWSMGSNFDMYGYDELIFEHGKVILDDGLECTIISANREPDMEWYSYL